MCVKMVRFYMLAYVCTFLCVLYMYACIHVYNNTYIFVYLRLRTHTHTHIKININIIWLAVLLLLCIVIIIIIGKVIGKCAQPTGKQFSQSTHPSLWQGLHLPANPEI